MWCLLSNQTVDIISCSLMVFRHSEAPAAQRAVGQDTIPIEPIHSFHHCPKVNGMVRGCVLEERKNEIRESYFKKMRDAGFS